MKKKTILYSIFLIAIVIITAFTFKKRHQENKAQIKANYTITTTWELPAVLNEVSGISWIGKDLFACVQDEEGKIFIYDVSTSKIIQEINFAGTGDYEGISVSGNDAYVMRSDGLLYFVKNYREKTKKVSEIQTKFAADNNMESLFFDNNSNALLTMTKDNDEENGYKNLYKISLRSDKPETKAIAKISMNADLLKEFKQKKINKTVTPSEVAVNPKTKEYYILDGKKPKLLVLDAKGELKEVFSLDKSVFAQPEGLTFSPDGRMFISNEAGKKGKANILEVKLHR